MADPDDPKYQDHGYSPPVNAAEAAIFEMFLHHRAVPAEQRNPVRAQLDTLAGQDGVRTGYEILAVNTRKKIKRLGKS